MILLNSHILPLFLIPVLRHQLALHNPHYKRFPNEFPRSALRPTQNKGNIYTLYHTAYIAHFSHKRHYHQSPFRIRHALVAAAQHRPLSVGGIAFAVHRIWLRECRGTWSSSDWRRWSQYARKSFSGVLVCGRPRASVILRSETRRPGAMLVCASSSSQMVSKSCHRGSVEPRNRYCRVGFPCPVGTKCM